MSIDQLSLLTGEPYIINEYITVKNPTLNDIKKFGEQRYWNVVYKLTATSYDLKLMLEENGIKYEDVSDFQLFIMMYKNFEPDELSLFFGDLDILNMELAVNEEIQDVVLISIDKKIVIDKAIHELIVSYLRAVHGLERNWKVAGNAFTRRFYMEEDRRLANENKTQPFESRLTPLISTIVNCAETKYNYQNVWDLSIYAFMDCVRRVQLIHNYNHLMTGIYTGNVDSKKINKKELNIFRSLD